MLYLMTSVPLYILPYFIDYDHEPTTALSFFDFQLL